MKTNDKTLADAQPGGRVRLGDQAERAQFEAWAAEHKYSVAMDGEQYEFAAARLLWKAWRAAFASGAAAAVTGTVLVNMGDSEAEFIRANDEEAALAAQPYPGGQEYAWNIAELVRADLDRQSCPDAYMRIAMESVVNHLAARQPVGEPVAVVGADFDLFWIGSGPIAPLVERNGLRPGSKLYAAPPAQAVDLAPVRDVFRRWHANELNSTDAMLALVEALAVIDSQAAGK